VRALEVVDVTGRRVLDVGSGAGHLARVARARGAALVDGIEQDERLLVLSRLLNAYHGTTRVSFSAALDDLDHTYDVVLAPAHGDAGPDPAAVARVTDGVLMAGADASLEKLRAAFPHQRALAVRGTEMIACAHRQDALPR
jgi:predicted nicotinamide N-methyase